MVKLFLDFFHLFVMRQKPQDIPYSKVLVTILTFVFFCININLNLMFSNLLITQAAVAETAVKLLPLDPLQSSFIVSCNVFIMWISLYCILAFYNLQNRFVQTISSILGVEIFLSVWLGALLVFPMSALTGILFVLMLYWQFMLHVYIFSNSLSCSLLKAGIFVLLYILLQHNINEVMFHYFMHG